MHLSEELKQYLLQRHGTIDLDPLPSMYDADPLNWPKWKVCTPLHTLLNTQQTHHNACRKS